MTASFSVSRSRTSRHSRRKGRVKNCVFGSREILLARLPVPYECPARRNKTDARHPESMGIECFFSRREQCGMIGQPEIVVRTDVENALAVGDRDFRILWTGESAQSCRDPATLSPPAWWRVAFQIQRACGNLARTKQSAKPAAIGWRRKFRLRGL